MVKIFKQHPEYLLYIAFAQAAAATLGSLFFSEILLLPPCLLCWYQRIAMYPQVLILGAAIVREEKNIFWYAFPLAVAGGLIAFYHTLLQWGLLPEAAASCRAGVSCTEVQVNYFGFVTIPFLALIAFIITCVSLYLYQKVVSSAGS